MQEFKIPENIPFDSIDTNQYYIYAYLRENDSSVAKAGTPYYIGKGKRHRAFRSDGRSIARPKNIDNIIFIAANIESENDAYRLEKYYTEYFGRVDLGTGILRNLQNGGLGGTNPSEETRKKRSKSLKGKFAGENNPMYGKHHTEETIEKMSQANSGKSLSEETKNKISEAHIGKFVGEKHPMYGKSLSEETRKKLSEAHIGKSHSEETRKKISEANIGKSLSEETRKKISKIHSGKRWYNDGEKEYFLKPSNEYDMKYNKGRIKNTQSK